jgi:hypothetical protein
MTLVEGFALCATPGCGNPVERPLRPVKGARPHRVKCDLCIAKAHYHRMLELAENARLNVLAIQARREASERKRRKERVK